MRFYLSLALAAEGKTDYRFLPHLLLRAVRDLCLSPLASGEIEIHQDVENIENLQEEPDSETGTQKIEKTNKNVVEMAIKEKDGYNLLFVHVDGAGNPNAAHDYRVKAISQSFEAKVGRKTHRIVGVVPVREMEAWALADGDALREAFRCKLTDKSLGLPTRVHEIEKILDPKKTLKKCYQQSLGKRRPRRRGTNAVPLERIADKISLDRLRHLPAYRKFEEDLTNALTDLQYLRRPETS